VVTVPASASPVWEELINVPDAKQQLCVLMSNSTLAIPLPITRTPQRDFSISNLPLTHKPKSKTHGPFVVTVTMVALPAVTQLATQYSKPASPARKLLQFNGSTNPTSPVPTKQPVPREPSGKKVTTSAPPVTLDALSATVLLLAARLVMKASTSMLIIDNVAQRAARNALKTTYVKTVTIISSSVVINAFLLPIVLVTVST